MKGFNRAAGFLAVLLAGLLLAHPTATADTGATELVKRASDQMLSALERQRALIERDPSKIYGLVDEILVRHFDFEKITQAVVGNHWSTATAAQQKALIAGFQQVLIRTYAKALLNYSGQEIRYLPETPGPQSSVLVSTQVREPGAQPIAIDYRLYKKGGDWKVYDIKIDNVSLVLNYRSSFQSQIRQKGLDGLIDRLEEMNASGQG